MKSFPSLHSGFVSFPGSWKTRTGFSQPRVHTVMGKDKCPQGTSPTHNCMNEWLGEPVLVSQLPGRGILRIYINNLAIKGVNCMHLEYFVGKQKSPCGMSLGLFCFPRENKKVLVMPCLCNVIIKNQQWENKKVLVAYHEDFFVFPNSYRH